MPRYRIPVYLEGEIEMSGDTENHALELLYKKPLSELSTHLELTTGEPELIREEQPLRSTMPYLTPVS